MTLVFFKIPTYIQFQSICKLLHNLAKFSFTKSYLKLLIAQRLWNLGNYKTSIISGKLGLDSKSPSGHQNANFDSSAKKFKKTCCKIFQRNTYFFNFENCLQYFLNDCLSLCISNLAKAMEISVISVNFSILKVSFALKTHI